MTDSDWKWYSGNNDEQFYNGPFETREEAVDALDGYGGFVIEARKDHLLLSDYFDAQTLLEWAEDSVDELRDEDGSQIFQTSINQDDDLQSRVRAVIDAWQDDHGLKFVPLVFSQSRNIERIKSDDETDEASE